MAANKKQQIGTNPLAVPDRKRLTRYHIDPIGSYPLHCRPCTHLGAMLCATKMLLLSHGNASVKTSYSCNSTRPKSLSLSPRLGDAEANKCFSTPLVSARATSPGTLLRVLSKLALVSARHLDSNDNSPMFYGVASQIEISVW